MGEFVKSEPAKNVPHVKMILPSGRVVTRDPEGKRLEGHEKNQVREIPITPDLLKLTDLKDGGHFVYHLEAQRKEKGMLYAGTFNAPDVPFVRSLKKLMGEPVELPGEPKEPAKAAKEPK